MRKRMRKRRSHHVEEGGGRARGRRRLNRRTSPSPVASVRLFKVVPLLCLYSVEELEEAADEEIKQHTKGRY